MPDSSPIPTLIITGPVGVGKTTIAYAISEHLNSLQCPHAIVDIDALRTCYPAPDDDPFRMELGFRNLAAVCANYREEGAQHLILVDVVESHEQIPTYLQAIPGAEIQVVRLYAPLEIIHHRLERREQGDSLRWHRNRAVELIELMQKHQIGDVVIDTEGKSIEVIAEEVLHQVGWLD